LQISRDGFKEVLNEYPEEYERMRKLAQERKDKNRDNRNKMNDIKKK